MSGSGVSAPPEWLCTTNAPPAGGKDCKPRTSARNHRLTIGPTTFVKSSLKAGSHLAISELPISLPLMPSPAVCALCLGAMLMSPLNDFVMSCSFSDQIAANHNGSIADQDPHESLAIDLSGGQHGQVVLG